MVMDSKNLDSILDKPKTLLSRVSIANNEELKYRGYNVSLANGKNLKYQGSWLYSSNGESPYTGKNVEVLNQYTHEKETVRLNLHQRVALALGRPVKESVRRYDGWGKEGLIFYVFKYKDKGHTFLMLDYPHSHDYHFHTDYRGSDAVQ